MMIRNTKLLAVAAVLLVLSLSCGAQTPGQQEIRLGWGDSIYMLGSRIFSISVNYSW